MISRRPNTRASTEYRPGPVPIMVKSIVSAKMSAGFESNTFGAQTGSKESAAAAEPNAKSTPANGVRKPTKRRLANAKAAKPRAHVASVGPGSPI